jgi:hypothetical protein
MGVVEEGVEGRDGNDALGDSSLESSDVEFGRRKKEEVAENRNVKMISE